MSAMDAADEPGGRPERRGPAYWVPDLALGIALSAFAVAESLRVVNRYSYEEGWKAWDATISTLVVALGFAVAGGCFRRAPGIGLMLVWLAGAYQLATATPVLLVQLAVVLVAFGTARYGRLATVWASALSVPLGAVAALLVVRLAGWSLVDTVFGQAGIRIFEASTDEPVSSDAESAVVVVGALLLAVPWLVGLVLRLRARVQVTRRERERAEAERQRAEAERQLAVEERTAAQEVARLRDDQARLARDVHDVVGHSLAVILAQAESAQFRDAADTEALKATMANIASSARASLQDVRQVLAANGEAPTQLRPGELDRVISVVAASGHEVASTESGRPRPLPPELDVVAVRVLQEMLTNAIKHGRRDRPVEVHRDWSDELRLEVRNASDPGPADAAGLGVDGMRRRLEAVGGRLEVAREGDRFTATAWIPLRSGA